MFDSLSDRFDGIFKKLRSRGRITDRDIDEMLGEVRTALLEADVNIRVVRGLTERIRAQCSGAQLSKAINPSQQVLKAVYGELEAALGGESVEADVRGSSRPTVVLMAGLQGSGKTTNSAKLARYFKSQGRQPLLVGADLQRPAAVDQLRTLGRQIDVPVLLRRRSRQKWRRRPGCGCASRYGRGPAARSRCRDRRHCRPAVDRRRTHAAGSAHLREGRARTTRSSSSTR